MLIIGEPREGENLCEFSVQSIVYSLFNFSITLKSLYEINSIILKNKLMRVKLIRGNTY